MNRRKRFEKVPYDVKVVARWGDKWRRQNFSFKNAVGLLSKLEPKNREAVSKLVQNMKSQLAKDRGNIPELRRARKDRRMVYHSMDLEKLVTYRSEAALKTPYYRYFGGPNSLPKGRFLVKKTYSTKQALREKTALLPKFTTAENLAEFELKSGFDIFEAPIKPQGVFYPGGDIQVFLRSRFRFTLYRPV